MALKTIFVKLEAVYEPVGSNLQALFLLCWGGPLAGHLPCLRLIRKIVYDMEAKNADEDNN